MVLSSVAVGLVFALLRIVWLIVAAVFLYEITVATGQFEIMKASVARLSADRRLQAVLVAFCFGAFIEGAAGFGAPVAISAAFLVGLGFDPFKAALLCLIANTAPVAWGSIGIPILTLEHGHRARCRSAQCDLGADPAVSVAHDPVLAGAGDDELARDVRRLASACGHRRNLCRRAIPVVQLRGVRAGRHRRVGLQHGCRGDRDPPLEAPGDLAVRARHRATRNRAGLGGVTALSASIDRGPSLTAGRIARAWLPYGLLVVTVMLWGLPPIKSLGTPAVKEWLDARFSWKPGMPSLHLLVAKGEAVTGHATPLPEDREKAQLDIVPLSCTGTAVFLAAVISGLLLGVSPRAMARLLAGVVRRMTPALAAIFCMLSLGFVTKYSGMDAVLGLAFTRSGPLIYPIFGTLLGWLGVALTGSDTSSNVLFGDLQKITAMKLDLNPILMASANTTGGVMGKMIDAQSIVVAAAATGEGGREGELLRTVFWHSVVAGAHRGRDRVGLCPSSAGDGRRGGAP